MILTNGEDSGRPQAVDLLAVTVGFGTSAPIENAQLSDFTNRWKRQNRHSRRTEVHRGAYPTVGDAAMPHPALPAKVTTDDNGQNPDNRLQRRLSTRLMASEGLLTVTAQLGASMPVASLWAPTYGRHVTTAPACWGKEAVMPVLLPEYFIAIQARDLDSEASPRYERQVRGFISMIAGRQSGRLILEWIRRSGTGRWVLIVPYGPYYQRTARVQALTKSPDWWTEHPLVGAKLNFSPEVLMGPDAIRLGIVGMPGALPDAALLHELVHAQRCVSGLSEKVQLTNSLHRYHDQEEFFATIVTNIYLSELGSPRLRNGHGLEILPAGGDTDGRVLISNDYVDLVKKYCTQHPRLSRALAKVKTQYNPFRAYYSRMSAER